MNRWHIIIVKNGAWLRDGSRAVFKIERTGIELLAYNLEGWRVPFNDKELSPNGDDVINYRLVEHPHTTDEADENNTCLFTCHDCGEWLKRTDLGYGSTHGWCGCLET